MSRTMLILCRISLNPLALEGEHITDPCLKLSLQNGLETSTELA